MTYKLNILVVFLIFVIIGGFFILHKSQPTEPLNISVSELSCPMFKCNIHRTGNLNFNPEKNDISSGMSSVGSNAPEGMERGILGKKDTFDPSPIFVDLDLDGIDEVITFYKNTIYNITTKSRPFHNFVMAIKYKENPTMLEKLEFGEVPYIRYWYFVLPSEVHTSFSVGDLNKDNYPEIAFGCDDGNLYVLNKEGKLLFKFKTKGKVGSTPAIADIDNDKKQEIIFGSDDNNLYCLDNEGKLKWKFESKGKMESSPAIFFHNNGAFITFGSDDRNFYILDGKGNLHCKFTTEGKIRSSPLFYKNKLVFGSDDRNIYLLDTNCNPIKKYITEGRVRGSPAVFRNYFVIGSEDGNLYFLNEKEIRNLSLDSPIFSTPASLEDKVLISTSNGKIYLTNLTSKKKIWENNLTEEFSCSPSLGNKYLFSCFFVQYENNDQFAGIFISSVNENYGKDTKVKI